jgi:multiple antibiotic resistance protein
MTILSAAITLLLVMDPMGNVPFFMMALRHVEPSRQRKVVVRELLIALGVMVFFLFAGQFLLNMMHISEPALTIAGGVILFLIAIRMVFPSTDRPLHEDIGGEPFVVPLAIPYVAGPSALATELLLMSRYPQRWADWLLALVAAWAVCGTVIIFGSSMRRLLGERGLIAAERLMGMVLITVSIQMLLDGLRVAINTRAG